MAIATPNVAPCTTSAVQSHGTSVSAPSAIDATNIQDCIASPRSIAGECCDSDTLHESGPAQTLPLPTPPDYISIVQAVQQENVDSVLHQIETGEFDSRTYAKILEQAHIDGDTFEEVHAALLREPRFARFFAVNATRQSVHEKALAAYCQALSAHPDSPVVAAHRLDQKGADALQVTSKGIRHGDEMGRLTALCPSIDLNLLVAGWSIMVSHKYTKDEGGAQDNAFANMREFVTSLRSGKFSTAPLHRSLAGNTPEVEYPAMYLAVVDGPFWNADRREQLARKGRATDTPQQGRVMVCTSADLQDIFSAL